MVCLPNCVSRINPCILMIDAIPRLTLSLTRSSLFPLQLKTSPRHTTVSQAKIILQWRAKCLKIKDHRPFQFKNKICRWCNLEEETVDHITNCISDEKVDPVCINNIDKLDQAMECKLVSLATRISNFLDMVDY